MPVKIRRLLLFCLGILTYAWGNAQCQATLSTVPPTCTQPGGYILTIPNSLACTGATPYTLDWGGGNGAPCFGQTPTLSSVPGPGTYVVTFTAGVPCGYFVTIYDNSASPPTSGIPLGFASNSLGPGNPSSLSFNIVAQTTPSCFGSCNASRTLFWNTFAPPLSLTLTSPTGSGTVQTTYSNVPAGSPITYPNLCAGTHSFIARDNNNCTFSTGLTFTVTQPSTLTATTATRQPFCNGGNNGSFSVAPTGGTANYTVAFSNNTSMTVAANGTAIATGYTAGAVSATVTDTRGCTAVINSTIGQPTTMTLTPSQTNVNCAGVCNGSAAVVVSGGGGGYTYTWSPGPGNSPTITGLCAGTHTMSVTDANSCTRTVAIIITQPAFVVTTPTVTNVVCNGNCTGSASVSASGTAAVSYTWLAPPSASVASNSSVMTNQCAGIYTILASTTPTCANQVTLQITQPPAISLTALTASVNCPGLCNGSGTANISGGNGSPYTFTWTSASGTPAPQNGSVATNFCSQSYTLAARDASNCPASTTFSIAAPAPFSFGITTTSLNCNGVCSGVINASPSGGTAPYNYTLVSAGSTVSSGSPVFANLCAGTYTLRVNDSGGSCTQTTQITLVQPNPLVPSISISSITCFTVCNGGLSGSASGGTPGYTLSWGTPGGAVSGGVLSNVCAGSYTFNITDANGCASSPTVVNLTQPPAITVNVNVTNATCSGSICNGAISATASGGTPGYTLTWSNGPSGSPNTNLCAGNYTLTTRDASQCTVVTTASVAAPPAILITSTVTPPTCAGSCNASATVTAAGGVGSFTFQFSPAPLVTNTTGVLSNRCAGNYIANVTDANGCSQSTAFTISNPVALSSAITGTRNSCSTCTGASTVTASNGMTPYTFAWTNSLNVSVGTASAVSSLCPGNYTASVTDNLGCVSRATVGIGQIVISSAVSGGLGIQCFSACTGSAVASASGGQAPYSFTWTPTGQTTGTAVNLCAGNYTVAIGDSGSPSCVSFATINVAQPPDLVVAGTETDVTCFNTCNGAITLTVSGGTGARTFSWSPGGMTTQNVSNLCEGIYTVVVTDANGCSKINTFSITPPFPPITAVMNPTNPTNCGTPNNGMICVTPGGGTGTYNYTWSPAVGGNTSCVSSLLPGTYSVIIGSGACTNTFFSILSTPLGPSLTLVGSQTISCIGGSNGSATFAATGVGPFTFTWTPSGGSSSTATTTAINNVAGGTYFLSSTDAGNNCVTTVSLLIASPTAVNVNGTAFNVRCNGVACDGSVTTSPSGGNPPYTFAWSNAATTQNINNVCADGYTVTVSDANGCPRTATFAITVPPIITIASTVTNVRCFGACNGSITVNASGGTGALSYSWLPVGAFSGSSTATVLNLCPNSYTVRARDVNSCFSSSVYAITEPTQLTSAVNVQQVSCANTCDGGATLTASGGTPTYSFSWSGSSVTASSRSGICAGNYTGNVIDANGCVSSQGFTLVPPAVLSATLVPTHPKCNAGCDGSVTTLISGNQGPVTFTWTPLGSGQNPTGLCAGNYTLTYADQQGCQNFAVVTLTNPPQLLANVTTTAPTCFGGCDGIAVSSPTNALAPVSFTWLPSGPNAATNSNLCNGTYTISISDANGCGFTQTFSVIEPPALSINPSLGPATCGDDNGTITASPVGGTPNYTFAWTSPNAPPITTTGSVATNLAAGIYTVRVTDSKNCTNTVTIPLSNSNGPVAPLTATNVLCNGVCTGAASVGVISSGASPYAIPVWINLSPTVQSFYVDTLCAGGYTVELRDNLGCLTYTGITITEPPAINIQSSIILPLCQGVCNGTITVIATGGVSPYTYTWIPGTSATSVLAGACSGTQTVLIGYNNGSCTSLETINVPVQTSISIGPPLVSNNNCFGDCTGSATINILSSPGGSPALAWSNGQNGNTATSLCARDYSVIITDAQGCTDTFTVPVTSPSQIQVSPDIAQPDCGRCNGAATVTASGGTGPSYTFNWSTGSAISSAENLCAGIYQVQVTDQANCDETVNILINNSTGITGDTTSTVHESCPGPCNGAATVVAVGGTAPISYNWSTITNSTTTASNLCAGSYFIQMTDAEGCVRVASVTINAASDLTLSTFVSQPQCTANNGSIMIQASGGNPAYTYSWIPAAPNSSVITNLGAGSYTVFVTGQNGSGCVRREIISLSNPDGPTFSFAQLDEACADDCSGEIVLTSTFSPAPTYLWSSGVTTPSVGGLCDGVISLTATAGGCRTVRTFTISGNPALQVESSVERSLCSGNCSGAINLQPTGGVLPYTFSWTPASANTVRADSLCPGSYSTQIVDANNCPALVTASVTEAPEMVVTPTITNSSCGPVADGAIHVSVTGGSPSFSFLWTGPGTFTSTSEDLQNIAAGTYSLALTDSIGCTADTVLSLVPTITLVAEAGPDFSVCPGAGVTLTGTNSQGAVGYTWSVLPQLTPVSTISSYTIPVAAQSQSIQLLTVSTSSNCVDTDMVVINVFTTPFVDAGPSFTMPVFSTVIIGGNPTADIAGSFTWAPGSTLSDSLAQNPVASNTVDVTYTVSIRYGNNCIVSDTTKVILYPEISITSGFTPNNDGKNDTWIIDYIDQFPENTVEIYNRWGERLFRSKGYATPFDGNFQGKPLPVGTYYYVILLNHPAYLKPYTGPLTIFR
jgi:large repetitive protein